MAKAKQNDSGVVLYAFGHKAYLYAAYNIAFSIKRFNPSVNITLFCENESLTRSTIWNCQVFDRLIQINPERIRTNGKFDPGKVKVTMYDSLPYKYNLYLDCDAVAIKDIQPLIDELIADGKPYISHTVGYHTIDQGVGVIPSMQWAKAEKVWKHWDLTDKSVLPAINSSLQFIVKSDKAAEIYACASFFYLSNPLPIKDLHIKWGGGQPDELYMNAAFARLDYDPAPTNQPKSEVAEGGYIHFAMRRNATIEQVQEQFYLQSYYGGRGFTASFYTEWLDRLLYKWHLETRDSHLYKISEIVKHKHANKK